MNIILKPFNCCPECYSSIFLRDYKRNEIYCSECGLILANEIPFKYSEHIKQNEKEQRQLNYLKQHKELKPIIEQYEMKVKET